MSRSIPILLAALCAAAAFAQSDEPLKLTLCDLFKDPARYNGKVVEFRANIDTGVQDLPSGVSDDSCGASLPFVNADDAHLVALLKSKEFRKLAKDVQKTPLVQATVTGVFAHQPAGDGKEAKSVLALEAVREIAAQPVKRRK